MQRELRMNHPLVSIIMPTYGRPEFLIRAVESVLRQDYTNYELIIVDDNNSQTEARKETETVLKPYLEKYEDKIFYIKREKNGGGSLARNDGIQKAKGEYITFLDDDDEYLQSKISEQVKHIIENDLDLSLCGMHAVYENKYINVSYSYPRGDNLKDFVIDGSAFTPMIMCKKSLIDEVGGFTITPRFQDHVLMLKLLSKKPHTEILKKQLYCFNIHDGERITYSKKSMHAIEIKHAEENKHINELSISDQKKIYLRQLIEKSSIMGRGGLGELKNLTHLMSLNFSIKNNIKIIYFYVKGWLSNYTLLVKIKKILLR